MNAPLKFEGHEVGYDIPAAPGMDEADIQTPCLMIDLDAMERNIARMQGFVDEMGVRLRVHGKMHKSADIALKQIEAGAVGICCQKVSEAESFARAGVKDVLVSNQVRDPAKIDRLARLTKLARTICCLDDEANIAELSAAAQAHDTTIEVLVEIDCGAGRCGVAYGAPVVELAKKIEAARGLKFSGIQAYQGAAQHVHSFEERKAKIDEAIRQVRETVEMLSAEGITCDIVGGAGTGSYYFEGNSGVYNEMQCGSYAFMDADYQRVLDEEGNHISEFENGVISDPNGVLKVNDKLKLVPGHIDPTCNVHDWYVGVRGGKVECVWPVTARGLAY
jgi:3-hydroxy-D-aspartate aldolase